MPLTEKGKKIKTDEEHFEDLIAQCDKLGKQGNSAALRLKAQLKGYLTEKQGKELFELTADDYSYIEQQAQRELDAGTPPYFGGTSEMQEESSLLLNTLRPDSGQKPDEESKVAELELSDFPD